MKKVLGISIVFALFLGVFSPAMAEIKPSTEITTPEATTFAYPQTKWELLSMVQNKTLKPGTYSASFNEEEVNGLIDGELSSLKIKWFVDKASVTLEDGYVTISAHVLRPFKGDITARGEVAVQDGVPVVTMSSAYYGFFPIPTSFVERVGNFVFKKKSPNEWFSTYGIQWNEVSINKGTISFAFTVPEEK